MPSIPSPAMLQILEIGEPSEITDLCELARVTHRKAILKIAAIEVGCDDMFDLDGRKVNKPQIVRMLREMASWSAAIIRECGGSQIASALPDQDHCCRDDPCCDWEKF